MVNRTDTTGRERRFALITSLFPVALAVAALCGWAFHIEILNTLVAGLPAMNPVVAVAILMTVGALLFLLSPTASTTRKLCGQVLAGAVVLIGLTKLVTLAYGLRATPLDFLLFPLAGHSTNRVMPIPLRTAINLILSGIGILLLDVRTRRGFRPTEILCLLGSIIGFLALIGYSYGLIVVYRSPTYEPMSLPGAIAFILLAAATLLARTESGAMRVIMSNTPAGLLARLMLPLAFLLPILFGTVRIAGENAGWFTTRVGVALFATAFILFFLLAVWWTVRLLMRSEMDRKIAEDSVRQLNADLEQRVADRTSELNRLNRELREASKAKDEFLAVLSHELRTPLTPALAAAGYLAEHADLPGNLREEANIIRTNVQLEARLIDDLLDLTRITRRKIELHPETIDAHEIIRKTIAIVDEQIRASELQIITHLHASHHYVKADPIRLQQVIWNLLTNAAKFSGHGGRITIRSSDDNGSFALEISDEGAGIDPALQGRIFDPFEQGEGATGRRLGGLGLGLAISKTLLDLQGGTIAVESAGKNRGSTFRLTLPLTTRPKQIEVVEPPPSAVDTAGLDLLVVDDHPHTLQLLSRLLRRKGHRVSTADSVRSAITLLDSSRFDGLISDIGLPDGNGCDLMREAKKRQGLRGIAVSGLGTESDLQRSKEAGFEQHLIKPFEFQKVEAWLGGLARA